MAPSHQLLVQSPDEDWISNFGNSTWRDPSPTQLGEVHPPKLELKPFTGLAKDWSVLSYGFKRLIYDNGRSDAKRLYDLRNYLLKYIQNSLDPDLLHSFMLKNIQCKSFNENMGALKWYLWMVPESCWPSHTQRRRS